MKDDRGERKDAVSFPLHNASYSTITLPIEGTGFLKVRFRTPKHDRGSICGPMVERTCSQLSTI